MRSWALRVLNICSDMPLVADLIYGLDLAEDRSEWHFFNRVDFSESTSDFSALFMFLLLTWGIPTLLPINSFLLLFYPSFLLGKLTYWLGSFLTDASSVVHFPQSTRCDFIVLESPVRLFFRIFLYYTFHYLEEFKRTTIYSHICPNMYMCYACI